MVIQRTEAVTNTTEYTQHIQEITGDTGKFKPHLDAHRGKLIGLSMLFIP